MKKYNAYFQMCYIIGIEAESIEEAWEIVEKKEKEAEKLGFQFEDLDVINQEDER